MGKVSGCKTVAEYMFRKWMQENNFIEGYFEMEVDGNTCTLKDILGDKLILEYYPGNRNVQVVG